MKKYYVKYVYDNKGMGYEGSVIAFFNPNDISTVDDLLNAINKYTNPQKEAKRILEISLLG